MSYASHVRAALSGPRVSLANASIDDPNGAVADYTLDNDGRVLSTVFSGTTEIGKWLVPAVLPGNYEARATLNSGSLSSGTTGSWLALSSDRSWTVGPGGNAGLTIEIRRASGSVLASATVGLSA